MTAQAAALPGDLSCRADDGASYNSAVAAADRLFAPIELARRIEEAELRMLADCAAAARRRDPATAAQALPLAGGVAVWAGRDQPFNKVAGLGFAGVPAEAELSAVERLFDAHGVPTRVELATLGDPEVGACLTRRGYLLVGFENVLGVALPAAGVGTVAAGVDVAESGLDELERWLDVVVDGFSHTDGQGVANDESFPRAALANAFADLAAGGGSLRFLARRDGAMAGGASLRLAGGVAQLCGAATLPAHRRRGVQSSLLAVRLTTAAAAGCQVAVVTTQPGSRSQQNVQRLGFDLLYSRAILVRAP